jgi:predicted RNase H-like HicB family nuclease
MKDFRIPLRIVFYKDNSAWIAHCLEFDLVGDGETKPAALEGLVKAIELQVEASIEFDNPANLFKPADGELFAKFAAGRDVACGEIHFKWATVAIDEAQTREYLEDESGLKDDLACTN